MYAQKCAVNQSAKIKCASVLPGWKKKGKKKQKAVANKNWQCTHAKISVQTLYEQIPKTLDSRGKSGYT